MLRVPTEEAQVQQRAALRHVHRERDERQVSIGVKDGSVLHPHLGLVSACKRPGDRPGVAPTGLPASRSQHRYRARAVGVGLNASTVFRAFKIPLDLKLAIDEAIDAVKSMVLESSSRLGGDMEEVRRMQEYGRLSHDLSHGEDIEEAASWSGASRRSEDRFDQVASNDRWGHGRWLSIEFDSQDLVLCRRLRLGDEVAGLLGYDPGEMIARHSNHEVLLQVSEY